MRQQSTGEKIAEAAGRMFARRGFEAVSIRDICREVGIRESTVYYYYENKKAILEYLLRRIDALIEEKRTAFDAALESAQSVSAEEMQRVAVHLLTDYLLHPAVREIAALLSIERISSSVPAGTEGSPMKAMMKIFLPEVLIPTKRNTMKLLRKLSGEHAEVFTDNPLILDHYGALLKGFNNMAMGYHKVTSFTREEIGSIREKLLYLVGDMDPFQKLGGKKVLEENGMHAEWYPDAGHGLNHELAEDINSRMLEYFGA